MDHRSGGCAYHERVLFLQETDTAMLDTTKALVSQLTREKQQLAKYTEELREKMDAIAKENQTLRNNLTIDHSTYYVQPAGEANVDELKVSNDSCTNYNGNMGFHGTRIAAAMPTANRVIPQQIATELSSRAAEYVRVLPTSIQICLRMWFVKQVVIT